MLRLISTFVVSVFAGFTMWFAQQGGNLQQRVGFEPGELVETIRVDLVVSADGDELDEPIAMDLGLGFPFWLQRLGRVENMQTPFGAVSQRGTDTHAIVPGGTATFEFSRSNVGQLDPLGATPQLLADVQVSDISRIGFTSKGDHGWIIAGYRIAINGKPFFANDMANARGRGSQDEARERLMELNRELGPNLDSLRELQSLVANQLATDSDRTQLAELESEMRPHSIEKRRIELQLNGAAPFYLEGGFQSNWRTNVGISKLKVTTVTAPHTQAETRNYVFFMTGGHKFLIGTPLLPLSPEFGSQEFELDLELAPLVASDIRGFGLGMLGHEMSAGDAPDRWHPQRMRVELDGRVVFDSDDNFIDRLSLSSIRLVPPVHLDAQGRLVSNKPLVREVFAWKAGSGAGLDVAKGVPESLPGSGEPGYPLAESVFPIDVGSPFGESSILTNEDSWYDIQSGPFPGEYSLDPSWTPGYSPGTSPAYGPVWTPSWGEGLNPGWGPGWLPHVPWFQLLVENLLDELGGLPDWVLPTPIGEPPQLGRVSMDYSSGTVTWEVVGDATQIDRFVVDVVRLLPDEEVPIQYSLTESLEVGLDQRSLPTSSLVPIMVDETPDVLSRGYMAIRVTMVPNDPAIGIDSALAPAMPHRVMPPGRQLTFDPRYEYTAAGGFSDTFQFALGGEPELPGRAVWTMGQAATQSGLVFAGASPMQHHVAVRPQFVNDTFEFQIYSSGVLEPGRYRVIAYVGFEGGVESPVEVNVSSNVRLQSASDLGVHCGHPAFVHVSANPTAAPPPMVPLITDFNTTDLGPGGMTAVVNYHINHLQIDPEHPLILLGIRLLEM